MPTRDMLAEPPDPTFKRPDDGIAFSGKLMIRDFLGRRPMRLAFYRSIGYTFVFLSVLLAAASYLVLPQANQSVAIKFLGGGILYTVAILSISVFRRYRALKSQKPLIHTVGWIERDAVVVSNSAGEARCEYRLFSRLHIFEGGFMLRLSANRWLVFTQSQFASDQDFQAALDRVVSNSARDFPTSFESRAVQLDFQRIGDQ